MPHANPEARRARARERYARNPETRRKALENAARHTRKRTAETKRRYRVAQRDRFKAAGLTVRGTIPTGARRERSYPLTIDSLHDRPTEQNARDAWRYFLRAKASDAWMRAYYEASGKPWRNPRLSEGERYALRYRMDSAFAQKERERTSAKRFRFPAYALQWAKDRARWYRAACSDDGTITNDLLKALRAQAHCAYCHRFTPRQERHLDHVMPLAKGGAHSADNLVMACGKCNRAKRDTLPLEWLIRISRQEAAGEALRSTRVGSVGVARGAAPRAPCAMLQEHIWVLPETLVSGSSKYPVSLGFPQPRPAFISNAEA